MAWASEVGALTSLACVHECIAVGYENDSASLWESESGTNWSRRAVLPPLPGISGQYSASSVVALPGGARVVAGAVAADEKARGLVWTDVSGRWAAWDLSGLGVTGVLDMIVSEDTVVILATDGSMPILLSAPVESIE